MLLAVLLIAAAWIGAGLLKLRYFDRNHDVDWLLVMSDKGLKLPQWSYWIIVLVVIMCWPIALVSKTFSPAWLIFILQWQRR